VRGFAVDWRSPIRRALLCAIRRGAMRWGKCASDGFAELRSVALDSRMNLGLRRAQLCGGGLRDGFRGFAVDSRSPIRRALLCAIRQGDDGQPQSFALRNPKGGEPLGFAVDPRSTIRRALLCAIRQSNLYHTLGIKSAPKWVLALFFTDFCI